MELADGRGATNGKPVTYLCPTCRWATHLARDARGIKHDEMHHGSGAGDPDERERRVRIGFGAQLLVLRELAKKSPLRAALAAVASVLQRRGALALGVAPLLPAASPQEAAPAGANAEQQQVPELEEHSAEAAPAAVSAEPKLGAGQDPGGGCTEGPAADGHTSADAEVASGSESAEKRQEAELVAFALQQAERFPPLLRWIHRQLATNPGLAHLADSVSTGELFVSCRSTQ